MWHFYATHYKTISFDYGPTWTRTKTLRLSTVGFKRRPNQLADRPILAYTAVSEQLNVPAKGHNGCFSILRTSASNLQICSVFI